MTQTTAQKLRLHRGSTKRGQNSYDSLSCATFWLPLSGSLFLLVAWCLVGQLGNVVVPILRRQVASCCDADSFDSVVDMKVP
jgi:hypothetical protein